MDYGTIAAILAVIGVIVAASLDKILLFFSDKSTRKKTKQRKQTQDQIKEQSKKLEEEKEQYEKMLIDFKSNVERIRKQLRDKNRKDH